MSYYCGKNPYREKYRAWRAAVKAWNQEKRRLYIYKCPRHSHFHCTSNPQFFNEIS